MKNFLLSTLGIVVLTFGLSSVVQGSLIDDEVTIQHFFSSSGNHIIKGEPTVVAGVGDIVNSPWYSVNMEANQVLVDFTLNTAFGDMDFNGLEVIGLNDDSNGLLTSVTMESNIVGWDDSLLTFGDDSLELNLAGLTVNRASYLTATLGFTGGYAATAVFEQLPPIEVLIDTGDGRQTPVPEPATMLLFGIGLTGFAGYSRKKILK